MLPTLRSALRRARDATLALLLRVKGYVLADLTGPMSPPSTWMLVLDILWTAQMLALYFRCPDACTHRLLRARRVWYCLLPATIVFDAWRPAQA